MQKDRRDDDQSKGNDHKQSNQEDLLLDSTLRLPSGANGIQDCLLLLRRKSIPLIHRGISAARLPATWRAPPHRRGVLPGPSSRQT